MTALDELPGIGKDLAEKITTILKTGDLPMRQELYGQVPKGLLELLKVPGLGPKKKAPAHCMRISRSIRLTSSARRPSSIASAYSKASAETEEKILQSLQHLAEDPEKSLPGRGQGVRRRPPPPSATDTRR